MFTKKGRVYLIQRKVIDNGSHKYEINTFHSRLSNTYVSRESKNLLNWLGKGLNEYIKYKYG